MKKILTTILFLFLAQEGMAASQEQKTVTVTLDVPVKISTFEVDTNISLTEDKTNKKFTGKGDVTIDSNAKVVLSVQEVNGGKIEMVHASDKNQKLPLNITLKEESNADMVTAGKTGVELATLARGVEKKYTLDFSVDGEVGKIQPGTWSTTLNVIANAS